MDGTRQEGVGQQCRGFTFKLYFPVSSPALMCLPVFNSISDLRSQGLNINSKPSHHAQQASAEKGNLVVRKKKRNVICISDNNTNHYVYMITCVLMFTVGWAVQKVLRANI